MTVRWYWTVAAILVSTSLAGAVIQPGCECVEFTSTFGQPFGQFTSPDFPKPYDPGIGCVLYTFTAPIQPASLSVSPSWIVELTITSLNLPQSSICGDGDYLSLYLHLERSEVNERTPTNGQVCAMPAKRSGRYGNAPLRYYSAMSTLVLAFHTKPSGTNPAGGPTTRLSAPSMTSDDFTLSSTGPYGFTGTYRFIRKSLFRSDGQRIAGSACDYQFISQGSGGATVGRQQQQQQQWRRGKFYSPLYPSLYPARSRCFYHFYGRIQERVKIHFEKLILGDEDVSCLSSDDGIKVYDGSDIQSPVIAHLCGVAHHAELWSSSSTLLVEFYSSNMTEHTFEGFEARYNFLPAVEGAEDDEDDIIDDEEEDEEEEDHIVEDRIHPPESLTPGVSSSSSTWSALATPRATTTTTTSTTTVATTTRRRAPSTTTTTTTSTTPRFVNYTTGSIRRIITTRIPVARSTLKTTKWPSTTLSTTTTTTRSPTPPPPEISDAQSNSPFDTNTSSPCDRLFRSDVEKNGTFTSPSYPSSYAASMNCNYEFRGHGRERVQIIFTDFVLHHPHDDPSEKPHHPWLRHSCDGADRVTAFISVGGNKEKIDDFCGSGTPRELMSNSAVMSLHFHSTAVSRGARGFKARYAFVSNFGITTGEQISSMPCAFRFNSSTSTNGTFWSPNFPGFYPRDTECHYFFHAQVGERVKIVFSYFDIEGMVPCGQTSASDYVEVSNFMTVDRKLPRYCGLQKDLKMESDGAFFRVTFKSNDRFDGTGFYASYQFTPVADAVTITRRRSSSPASSSPYPVGCILLFSLLAYVIS